jgi:hypothetical protein
MGLLVWLTFGNSGISKYSWLGPLSGVGYNWMYFWDVVKDESSANDNVFVVSTISNDGTSGGSRRFGVTKFAYPGTETWTRTLSAGSGANLFPQAALASDTAGNVYAAGSNQAIARPFIAKYNSSGTLQWQREFVQNVDRGIFNIVSIALEGTSYLSIEMQVPGQPQQTAYCRIPTDGTKTGTYDIGNAQVVYQASSYTDASESFTSQAAPSYVVSTSWGWTATNSSLTIADANLTVQAVTI